MFQYTATLGLLEQLTRILYLNGSTFAAYKIWHRLLHKIKYFKQSIAICVWREGFHLYQFVVFLEDDQPFCVVRRRAQKILPDIRAGHSKPLLYHSWQLMRLILLISVDFW
jgi:hypothetical protein